MSAVARQPIPQSERGSALLAALCFAIVFAIAISSYLGLCFTSLAMSSRNIMGTHSLELAEAGVEQALYANNNGVSTGWTVVTVAPYTTMSTTMTMTASGLVASSLNPTPFEYGNGATGQVNITMTYATASPSSISSITSQGVVSLPVGSIISGATPTVSRTLTYSVPGTRRPSRRPSS